MIGSFDIQHPVVDPYLIEDVKASDARWYEGMKNDLRWKAKNAREEMFSHLRDAHEMNPADFVNDLNELTETEKRMLSNALKEPGDILSLPRFYKRYLGGRNPYYKNRNAAEKDAKYAAQRLWRRGLASIIKIDGINHLKADRTRVAEALSRYRERRAEAAGGIYLIEGICKTQTLEEKSSRRSGKSRILDIPKNCSGSRLAACRHLTGVRRLSKADKQTLSSYYNTYINDINEKVIALLDGRTNKLVGMEYSTRFNDLNKAKRNLDNFETVMKATFNVNNKDRKAVFLTLTSDPNYTDEEKRAEKMQRLADVETRIATSKTGRVEKLIEERYKILGPDKEIADLEALSQRTEKHEKRLQTLLKQRDIAYGILAEIESGVGKRRLEKLNHQLSTMNRLERHYDPEGHQSLWETNRAFSYSWNAFLSYINKRLGKRPQYICAFEYTKSGLMHCHAIIILPYLLNVHEISMEWERLGQGSIVHTYSLKARENKYIDANGMKKSTWEWRWANPRNKPPDSTSMHGGAYLEKYLKKAVFANSDRYESPSEVHFPYWSFNKRFWTCSVKLREEAKMIREAMGERTRTKEGNSSFSFAGVFDRSLFSDLAQNTESAVYSYFRYNSPYWDVFHPPKEVGD